MINSILEKEAHIRLHIPSGITTLFRNNEIMGIIHKLEFTVTDVGNDQFTLYFTKSPTSSKTLKYQLQRLSTDLFLKDVPHAIFLSEITPTAGYSDKDIEMVLYYLFWFSENLEEQRFWYEKIPLLPIDILSGNMINLETAVSQAKDLSKNLKEYHRLSDNQITYLSTVKAKQLLNN